VNKTRIAIVGFGGRISGMVAELGRVDSSVHIAAVADPNMEQTRERLAAKGMAPSEGVKLYSSADQLFASARDYDAILIGTRCHLHTALAVQACATGLPLFLEKPVAINFEQAAQLAAVFKGAYHRVVVSFPLRVTDLFLNTMEIIRTGRIGRINQIQAHNNVTYGGVYFGQWYRNYDEAGGLWLQKATHDFDYINQILDGARPVTVSAMTTHKIFGGDKPHDLVCSKCDRTETCMESPKNIALRGDAGGMVGNMPNNDHYCAFSEEIKNEDSGSALIKYDDGTLVSYSQNFVSRKAAGKRGATIIGYSGTIEFDWYTEKIKIIDHHRNRVDEVVAKAAGGHMGGDTRLCQMFSDVIHRKCKSQSDLSAGLLSASMCLAARDSTHNSTFERIKTVKELAAMALAPAAEKPRRKFAKAGRAS
jgi:predicted dehydrogenase